jgi:hypothetical protein
LDRPSPTCDSVSSPFDSTETAVRSSDVVTREVRMTRPARQALGAIVAYALGLTAITVIASYARVDASAQTPATDRVPRIIDSLNDCVQERFKEVDERLGTARVTRPGAPHLFTPERLREQTVVEELEHARMRVVLYLAGREVLKPKPDLRFRPTILRNSIFRTRRS